MDFVQIAKSAVALLAPYLAKVVEGTAQKAGESIWEKTKALYQTIANKFREDKDVYAEQTLQRLKSKPSTQSRQRALVDVLVEKLKADSKFAEELNQLMQNTTQGQDVNQFLTQVYGGEVNKIVNIGTARDVTI